MACLRLAAARDEGDCLHGEEELDEYSDADEGQGDDGSEEAGCVRVAEDGSVDDGCGGDSETRRERDEGDCFVVVQADYVARAEHHGCGGGGCEREDGDCAGQAVLARGCGIRGGGAEEHG